MVSVFENIENPQVKAWYKVESILNFIKSSEHQRDRVNAVRVSENYKEDKKALPCVTWGGFFSKRALHGLRTPSNYIYIDIDNVDPTEVKEELKDNPYIYAMWASVSQRGLGLLFKSSGINKSNYKSTYLAIYEQLEQEGYDVDKLSDISRANFISYDPDIYINDDCWEFEAVEPKVEFNDVIVQTSLVNTSDREYVERACGVSLSLTLREGYSFSQGNMHYSTLKYFARAIRFGVELNDAYNYLAMQGKVSSSTYRKAEKWYREFGSDFGLTKLDGNGSKRIN